MGIYKDVKNSFTGKQRVFGTFDVDYDQSEFERERSDGTTILDLVPDCRVFIAGMELTHDVINVNVQNKIGGNTCSIKLANPRGKYEITKQDLAKYWREDKEILAFYEYDNYKRLTTKKLNPFSILPDKKSVLQKTAQFAGLSPKSARQYSNITSSIAENVFGLKSSSREALGFTQMLYEIKNMSGLFKKVGDIIFDYRDPVYVFMKGRFSPFWYFAFSGFVTGYDDADVFGQSSTLNISCEDILNMLKKTKVSQQGSLYNVGNLESAMVNSSKSQKTNIYGDLSAHGPLYKFVKLVIYGTDYGSKVKNSHISANTAMFPGTFHNEENMNKAFGMLNDFYGISNAFESNSDFMCIEKRSATGVTDIHCPKNEKDFITGPNSMPLSHWHMIYPQYNELRINEFNGFYINDYYDTSVRFWEADHDIQGRTSKGTKTSWSKPASGGYSSADADKNKTGWADVNAYGIAGIHPALRYSFIDNFQILPNIWDKCRKAGRGSGDHDFVGSNRIKGDVNEAGTSSNKGKQKQTRPSNVLEKLNISPIEKIRETIFGSPTERRSSTIDYEMGVNLNVFRPRLFLVLPKKYMGNHPVARGALSAMSLMDEKAQTAYQVLTSATKGLEYQTYTTPCGDIIIEPALYDTHPLDFYNEKRSHAYNEGSPEFSAKQRRAHPIIENSRDIKFRLTTGTQTKKNQHSREDTAYQFNTKINHPFFIMEKDRIRITQSFKPQMVKTVVRVFGSATNSSYGFVENVFNRKLMNQMSLFQMGSKKSNRLQGGLYIADGMEDSFRAQQQEGLKNAQQTLNNLKNEYKNNKFVLFFAEAREIKINTLLKDADNALMKLMGDESLGDFYPDIQNKYKEIMDSTDYSPPLPDFESEIGDAYVQKILGVVAPTIYMSYLQRQNKINYQKRNPEFITVAEFKKRQKESNNNINISKQTVSDFLRKVINKRTQRIDSTKTAQAQKGVNSVDINKIKNAIAGPYKKYIDDLIRMFEISQVSQKAKDEESLYSQYKTVQEATVKYKSENEVRTSADIKRLIVAHQYNPSQDMVRQYGFNRGPEIENLFIQNGEEAKIYAKIIFQQLYARAFELSMDLIGRPEFMLNRTYYVEKKDCIGLLEEFQLNFSINAAFLTEGVRLSYIRKNSITYYYSYHEFEALTGVRNSDYFASQLESYYKYKDIIKKLGQGAGKLIGRTINKELGNISGDLLSGGALQFPSGGIYVAHDMIGHMDYDHSPYYQQLTDSPSTNIKNLNVDVATVVTATNKITAKYRGIADLNVKIKHLKSKIETLKTSMEQSEKQKENATGIQKKTYQIQYDNAKKMKINGEKELSEKKKTMSKYKKELWGSEKEPIWGKAAIFKNKKALYWELEKVLPDLVDKNKKWVPTNTLTDSVILGIPTFYKVIIIKPAGKLV